MKYIFSTLLCFCNLLCIAQNELTENFAYNVKSIDDFIERFNFEKNTEFEKYLNETSPGEILTREKLILSLFNFKNKFFYNNPEVKSFVAQVSDTNNNITLNFNDTLWYAEAECKVIFNSKAENLFLILRVEQEKNGGTKWSIISAKGAFLGKRMESSAYLKNESLKNRLSDTTRYFLHPVSHAIDFMNIDLLFSTNKKSIEDYIYRGFRTVELEDLILKVKNSRIKFIQVNTISYHLLQIDGWIAIVDYINRNEKNSGWLINSLFSATDEEKKIYLKEHLNVQLIK